jgi:hypothetical protein
MEKIKRIMTNSLESERGKDVLTVLIVILVGLGSFELGRLSVSANSSSGIKIEYPSHESSPVAVSKAVFDIKPVVGKTFFASNRGTKYYSLGCSGGKTIKMENRVYFATKEEAERAGYELSSSCK